MGESMVSRVAKSFEWAVSLNCHDEGCRCLTERERWECLTGTYPEEIARAAIEAMRQPTTPMLEAATRFENRRDEGRVEVNYVVVAMDIWPKMIDAALNPPKQKAGP